MTTVTSKTGTRIALDNTGHEIIASVGAMKFSAVQTATGFASRFLVGGRRIEAVLEGAELVKAAALFAELSASVDAIAAEQREYDRRYAQIARA